MKKTLSIMLMMLLSISCYANGPQVTNTVIGNSIGIGSAWQLQFAGAERIQF